MFSNEKITLIFSVVFSFTLVKMIQVFCLPSNINIRQIILLNLLIFNLLIYGSEVAAFEIYKGRNIQNYGIT